MNKGIIREAIIIFGFPALKIFSWFLIGYGFSKLVGWI